MDDIYKQRLDGFRRSALEGIMASIPFGVTVDPWGIAQAADNVAKAMMELDEPEPAAPFPAP